MQIDFPSNFMSIRELAKTGFLPEAALRRLAAQKSLPGFYSGKKFLINTEMLTTMLDDPISPLNAGDKSTRRDTA